MSELKSKFISQAELDEKRRKRQEEWEKVRSPDQPLEAPEKEEEIDRRSLMEQKDKAEYEEQHKLISVENQVRGLESDEADFREFVSKRQHELEKEHLQEEQETLDLLREPVTKPVSTDSQSCKPMFSKRSKKRTQDDILSQRVKRKRSNSDETPDAKKIKDDSADESENACDSSKAVDNDAEKKVMNNEASSLADFTLNNGNLVLGGEAPMITRVVGVLPGIGVHSNSSDTDSSSSDSEIDTDIFRRCISKDVEKMIQAAHQH